MEKAALAGVISLRSTFLVIEKSPVVQRQRTAWTFITLSFAEKEELFSLLVCSDIYFVGGFGTVAWVDVKEYSAAKPDVIAASNVSETLQVCESFSKSRNNFLLFVGVHRKKPLGMAPELLEARGCISAVDLESPNFNGTELEHELRESSTQDW